jgi:hypothetical protein
MPHIAHVGGFKRMSDGDRGRWMMALTWLFDNGHHLSGDFTHEAINLKYGRDFLAEHEQYDIVVMHDIFWGGTAAQVGVPRTLADGRGAHEDLAAPDRGALGRAARREQGSVHLRVRDLTGLHERMEVGRPARLHHRASGHVVHGIRAHMKPWRVKTPCENCPFNEKGPGHFLRLTLGPKWERILADIRRGNHFFCHKTLNTTRLVCAGSIEFEDKHGLQSDARQVMERLELARKMSE